MEKPNAKQEKFCREYIIDLNATQAAIRAGYSEATAAQTASRMLSKVKIQERIAELQEDAMNKVEIDAQNVLNDILDTRDTVARAMARVDDNGLMVVDASLANARTKANELLGKHLKLFTDKVETTNENFNHNMDKKERKARIEKLEQIRKRDKKGI